MTRIFFIDTETTGLDPEFHRPWEVYVHIIEASTGETVSTHHWFVRPTDREMRLAHPVALEIGRFKERYDDFKAVDRRTFAMEFMALWNKGDHWAGACPWFDVEMICKLIADMVNVGVEDRPWHYHFICVENLLLSYALEVSPTVPVPWRHSELVEIVNGNTLFEGDGIPALSDEDKHTAKGDADAALAVWRYFSGRSN